MKNRFQLMAVTLTLAWFAIAGCVHGGTTVQPAMEPTTTEHGPVETTTVKDPVTEPTTSVLVQGTDVAAVAAAVRAVGGRVTHELGIINTVGARLTPTQMRRLEASDATLRIQPNRATSVSAVANSSAGSAPDGQYDESQDDPYDQAAAWDTAEQRGLTVTSDWKKSAKQAVSEAKQVVKTAKALGDDVALKQARHVLKDAKQWKATLKAWARAF